MSKLLVLTEHVAYLTTTYTYVTSRNVLVRTNVTIQFVHKCLAETHHLSVALATRREVRTSLATAHRQSSEGILECLLKRKELQD